MKKNQLLIAVVVLFAVIVVSPYLINGDIETSAVKGAVSITRDVTGTVWTCTWDNTYTWKTVYDDESIGVINGLISAENINCDSDSWSCEAGNKCSSDTEGMTCICRQQLTTAEPGSSD